MHCINTDYFKPKRLLFFIVPHFSFHCVNGYFVEKEKTVQFINRKNQTNTFLRQNYYHFCDYLFLVFVFDLSEIYCSLGIPSDSEETFFLCCWISLEIGSEVDWKTLLWWLAFFELFYITLKLLMGTEGKKKKFILLIDLILLMICC